MARRPPASQPARPRTAASRASAAAPKAAARKAATRKTAPRRVPAERPAPDRPAPDQAPRPEVIVDFTVDHGLLFVSLRNLGPASAYDVATRFDRRFHGLGGRKDMTALTLFQALPFLPPGKQIAQLVDAVDAYFRRHEPTTVTATLTYRDRDGRRFTDVVRHDLAIYRDAAEALGR